MSSKHNIILILLLNIATLCTKDDIISLSIFEGIVRAIRLNTENQIIRGNRIYWSKINSFYQ